MNLSYVEVTDKELLIFLGPKHRDVPTERWRQQKAEDLFWSLAGPMAVPLAEDGMVWQRQDWCNTYRAYFYYTGPEGMLL